jgi:hypothetical protein
MEWEIRNTRTLPTIIVKRENKIYYLHSKYDPIKEAKAWVDNINIEPTLHHICLIGIGLGYHVNLLAKKYPKLRIHVFEFNYAFVKWLLGRKKLSSLFENKNIFLHHGEDMSFLLKQLSFHLSEHADNFLLYKPSLELIEQKVVRRSLESFFIKKRTIREQKELLNKNFESNIRLQDQDISSFIGEFKNKPTIIVSAGPSLSKQLPLLKKAFQRDVIIACVGTALLPLIKAGIKPNLIMISDPKELIVDQFLGIEKIDVPLFYLSTANHSAVKQYKGSRYIVWQSGYPNAEFSAKQFNVPLIETGGSVATCLLDLMVKLGSKAIALVGQDLAFTNNKTHANGTHLFKEINEFINTLEVEDYFRKEKIKTSRNLYIYLKWFEKYVEEHEGKQFWNCTEGGAHIRGWKHRPLSEFLCGII